MAKQNQQIAAEEQLIEAHRQRELMTQRSERQFEIQTSVQEEQIINARHQNNLLCVQIRCAELDEKILTERLAEVTARRKREEILLANQPEFVESSGE